MGNKFVFVSNVRMFQILQTTLSTFLREHQTNGTYLFSKAAGGEVKVGATFRTYEFMGNEVTFQIDDALTKEYPNQAYGLMLDMTHDTATGRPAVLTNIWIAA